MSFKGWKLYFLLGSAMKVALMPSLKMIFLFFLPVIHSIRGCKQGNKAYPWEVATIRPWGKFTSRGSLKKFQNVNFKRKKKFFFFKYNSCTIKFTFLKCTVQWGFFFFGIFTKSSNHHHIQFQNTFITPKRDLVPVTSHSTFPLLPPTPGCH